MNNHEMIGEWFRYESPKYKGLFKIIYLKKNEVWGEKIPSGKMCKCTGLDFFDNHTTIYRPIEKPEYLKQ